MWQTNVRLNASDVVAVPHEYAACHTCTQAAREAPSLQRTSRVVVNVTLLFEYQAIAPCMF